MVVLGSVFCDSESFEVIFKLIDMGLQVIVIYVGILLDLFCEGQGIVVIGVLVEVGVIQVEEVLVKYDEEYMLLELVEQMKGIKYVKFSEGSYEQ